MRAPLSRRRQAAFETDHGAVHVGQMGLAAAHAHQHGGQAVHDSPQRGISGHGAQKRLRLEQLLRGGLDLVQGQEQQAIVIEEIAAIGRRTRGNSALSVASFAVSAPAACSASSGVAPSITARIRLLCCGNRVSKRISVWRQGDIGGDQLGFVGIHREMRLGIESRANAQQQRQQHCQNRMAAAETHNAFDQGHSGRARFAIRGLTRSGPI